MSTEWSKAKAEQLIRLQVDQVKQSQCPEPDLCEGMIQMAYALSLITDTGLGYWQRSLEVAVANRRQELVNARYQRTLEKTA
jgi:hypothetical protein